MFNTSVKHASTTVMTLGQLPMRVTQLSPLQFAKGRDGLEPTPIQHNKFDRFTLYTSSGLHHKLDPSRKGHDHTLQAATPLLLTAQSP